MRSSSRAARSLLVLAVGAILSGAVVVQGGEAVERLQSQAIEAFDRGGVSALQQALQPADPQSALVVWDRLGRLLFSERHDISASIAVRQAGMAFGEQKLVEIEPHDPVGAEPLRWRLKVLTFNLAADLWPAWEDSPALTDEQLAIGLQAARRNRELTEAAARGPGTLAIADWMVGAHLLAAEQHAEAIARFEASASWARDAANPAAEQSARAFRALARLLRDENDGSARADLETARSALLQMVGEGPFLEAQLDPAWTRLRARMKSSRERAEGAGSTRTPAPDPG